MSPAVTEEPLERLSPVGSELLEYNVRDVNAYNTTLDEVR